MSNWLYPASAIAVMALVTLFLRVFPFVLFQNRPVPASILYLGKVLPFAIMGMLVVYCLRNTNVISFPFGIPELISVAVVVLLQIWKRNTLISIVLGTVCYMVLIQIL